MFLLGVVIVALAMLFLLTALALGAAGRIGHPRRAALVIASASIVGAALVYEFSVA